MCWGRQAFSSGDITFLPHLCTILFLLFLLAQNYGLMALFGFYLSQNCVHHLDLGSLWLLKNVLTSINKSANSQVGRKMGYVMLIVHYKKNTFKICFSPHHNIRRNRLYLCVALRDVLLTTSDPHLSVFCTDSFPDKHQ